ncbi:peptidoglycan/xylan/chitin deacetylase (PgdA/CDA1 family) [Antricoccus suffuscus]|uniref:Peptidoglycan/xylan/chitin deacetylase (PgdA/CDA1 family) n=1 Tax=Antricoccus suffuscus TaxID=1629062 RepID=A0A2T0ZBL4_9ACTN|nr:polysaccharide deacetylase family protein [Antricoccus suffuscus]PRZ33574.1 peptidoglycan/xylan/chitin deacetylase (PgdA/CDA1 family) [Antricoccus suffuscus]
MSVRLPKARSGAAIAAVTATAAYWTTMSSYSQLYGAFPYRARTLERVVALTFDDGPNEPHTSRLADILATEDVRATFFQVGRCIERHPEVTARLAAAGHLIGNHSYSHQFHRCWNDATMRLEIDRTQTMLTEILGTPPVYYRPPWLLRTPSLFRTLNERGLTPISGEFCHAFEPVQPPAAAIARRALAKARPGAVLIFHDGFDGRGGNRAHTVQAVRIVIRELKRRGYRFATIDELLAAA